VWGDVSVSNRIISARKIFTILAVLLLTTILGVVLIFMNISFGKVLVYLSVPAGAILTIFAAIAAGLGKVDKDV
jgi:hypothetical protein